MSAANQIDYIEFQAKDLAATKQFFEQLLEWRFTDYGPDYTSFAESGVAGGFARGEKHSTIESGGALVVIYHPRLEEIRQRVIDLGGKITRDIFSFPAAGVSTSPSRAATNAPSGRKSYPSNAE